MNLFGKRALVTGGGRGIGRGCAVELARGGADVAVNDLPSSPDLPETLSAIRLLGRQAVGIEADAFTRQGCQAIIDKALAALGQIDVLVHCPAVSQRGDFLDYDPAAFQRTLDGTLTSGFHASQLVARHMVARGGGGKIVFISSVQAFMPYQRSVAYNAAKAGLVHMARSIARELMPHRINVNVIAPGWIDTPQERATFGNEMIEREGPRLPWGRIGQPEDIGRAAAFLASDAADYITAQVLVVDGGFLYKDA